MVRRVNKAKYNYRNHASCSLLFHSRSSSSRPAALSPIMPHRNSTQAGSARKVEFADPVDFDQDLNPEEKRDVRREYRKLQDRRCDFIVPKSWQTDSTESSLCKG